MIHNDIPLLMAIPVAWVFELIDPFTAIFALLMTIVDFISMLTYLNHDDELSIDAIEVYALVQKRRKTNAESVRALKLDDFSSEEDDDAGEDEVSSELDFD